MCLGSDFIRVRKTSITNAYPGSKSAGGGVMLKTLDLRRYGKRRILRGRERDARVLPRNPEELVRTTGGSEKTRQACSPDLKRLRAFSVNTAVAA